MLSLLLGRCLLSPPPQFLNTFIFSLILQFLFSCVVYGWLLFTFSRVEFMDHDVVVNFWNCLRVVTVRTRKCNTLTTWLRPLRTRVRIVNVLCMERLKRGQSTYKKEISVCFNRSWLHRLFATFNVLSLIWILSKTLRVILYLIHIIHLFDWLSKCV